MIIKIITLLLHSNHSHSYPRILSLQVYLCHLVSCIIYAYVSNIFIY